MFYKWYLEVWKSDGEDSSLDGVPIHRRSMEVEIFRDIPSSFDYNIRIEFYFFCEMRFA